MNIISTGALFVIATYACIILLTICVFFLLKRNKNRYSKSTFEALWEIEKVVLQTVSFEEATKKVVNIILSQLGYLKLGYQVVVLSLLDREKNEIRRIAISQTTSADEFLHASPIPFHEIVIPLSAKDNLLVRTIHEKNRNITENISDILTPALDEEWVKKFQEHLGIKTSIVYPVMAKDKVLGTLNFSLTKKESQISEDEWTVLESFVGAVGIALDNALLFQSVNQTANKLKVANEKLKELDKLKDEFVSIASHELRTPLTVIRSYVDLLLTGKAGKLSNKQTDYLEKVFSSSNRLGNLVNTMLDLSRIESGRIKLSTEEVNIGELVSEVVTEMRARADEQKIELILAEKEKSLVMHIDKERIREVLVNLIGNSLKYTASGSIYINILSQKKENTVTISIKDTGIGIRKEDMGKLFKKFGIIGSEYSVKRGITSTGLGLYLSQKLVELHGGEIWAESEGEGKGSTFSFSLPLKVK